MFRRSSPALPPCRCLYRVRTTQPRFLSVNVQRVRFSRPRSKINRALRSSAGIYASAFVIFGILLYYKPERTTLDRRSGLGSDSQIGRAVTKIFESSEKEDEDSVDGGLHDRIQKINASIARQGQKIKNLEQQRAKDYATRPTETDRIAYEKFEKQDELIKQEKAVLEKLKAEAAQLEQVDSKVQTHQKKVTTREETLKNRSYEDDESTFFLPLWWARQVPTPRYKGSDPEWKEFQKFHADPNRGNAVRRELINLIQRSIETTPDLKSLKDFLGEPTGVQHHWLDIDYPSTGPPEYAQYGIEFSDQYISGFIFLHKYVNPNNVKRFDRYTQPLPILKAVWSGCAATMTHFWQKLSNALSQNSRIDVSDLYTTSELMKETIKPGRRSETTQDTSSTRSTASSNSGRRSTLLQAGTSSTNEDSSKIGLILPSTHLSEQTKNITAPARQAFRQKLNRSRAKISKSPRRGCLRVSGLVEIQGPRSIILIDVFAWYHPKYSEWDSVSLALRRHAMRPQASKTSQENKQSQHEDSERKALDEQSNDEKRE